MEGKTTMTPHERIKAYNTTVQQNIDLVEEFTSQNIPEGNPLVSRHINKGKDFLNLSNAALDSPHTSTSEAILRAIEHSEKAEREAELALIHVSIAWAHQKLLYIAQGMAQNPQTAQDIADLQNKVLELTTHWRQEPNA